MLLKFKGSWRSYQKRILDSLDYHLLDKKLHVVAAPGAGKTTLGIEVISRIKKPSLILCPTNTIKNQWRDRICSAFLEEDEYDKVSTDIRKPAYLTVTTYQALLAAFCEGSVKANKKIEDVIKENDELIDYDNFGQDVEGDSITSSKRFSPEKADEIIKILKKSKISLLCFDEAHHLRKEWWKALTYLVDNLEPSQTMALTATPPYDVEYSEWERYEELCGPIDETISIPELVKNGDLCPHQDFIYFSLLRENENEMLNKHNSHIAEFLGKILKDRELFNYFANMSFLNPNDDDVAKIFDNPDLYVAIVSLLKSGGVEISKNFLKLFDAKQSEIPSFSLNQAKVLFNGLLITNTDSFPGLEVKIEEYNNLARRLGLIHNKKFVLNDSSNVQKQIAHSLGKLDSIVEIVQIETDSMGDSLRMVILADNIRADDLDNSHLGVIPIWRTVKDKFSSCAKIGVLCGSLILLPKFLQSIFVEKITSFGLDSDSVSIVAFKEDESFIKIVPKESAKNSIVVLITDMFNHGYITILVGTQALLGEGWDAPSINSLILSSTVSSYMLSNQMRGRAIRVDKNNPDKISNIWHLASVRVPKLSEYILQTDSQNFSSGDDVDFSDSGYYDLNQLSKRFEGYEAPSYYGKHEIESGIYRIVSDNLKQNIMLLGEQAFNNLNKKSVELAKNRAITKQWWNTGLSSGYSSNTSVMSTGVQTPKMSAKNLTYTGYKQLMFSTLVTFIFVLMFMFSIGLIMIEAISLWLIALCGAELYLLYKYIKTGSVSGIMKQIAIVHLETLSYLGFIKCSLKNIGIKVENLDYIFLSCKNLPTEDNNLLITCLREFLDPIDNPRYVLIKKDRFLGLFGQVDYFAIPAIISSNKRDVEIFEQLWHKYIGPCEIVYTRNLEGRKLLLKARKNAFSASKREKTKRLSKWQ